MRIWLSSAAMALAHSGCVAGYSGPVETVAVQENPVTFVTPPERDPADLQVLFWSDEQRSARFRDMENWFEGHEVKGALEPRPLPDGVPLDDALAAEIRGVMDATNAAGVMVLQNGQKRFESYRLGFGPEQRWTSFSVAKSFTSTLLGAAIRDGFIGSLQDPVTNYIPELAGSAYDDVTVEQLATMTSGVAWNEDYTDPDSDVAKMASFVLEYGEEAMVAQMKDLPREAPPGEKWVYKTGETNLIGLVVENAVGLPLAAYAKQKIVNPAGFEADMFWMSDPRGGSIGGCCLSIRLADYARMGQFALEGGEGVVPDGWFGEAGDSKVDFERPGFGYGYQWWVYDGGYGAQGIFGQSITIIPEQGLVIAVVSNWPTATSNARGEWYQLVQRIAAAE